jgi:multimeric flavodoxin WrbA
MTESPVRYLALNCTLKPSPADSSTDRLLAHATSGLERGGAVGETIRIVDHDVAFGVTDDEGDGDGWPAILQKVQEADILLLGTPIWLGHPASVAQVVMERLDAKISETDDRGQQVFVDKVGIVAVVGNEDGAHHVGAEAFQALSDIGFTIPAGGMTYWVGEAMGSTDLKDLDEIPESTATSSSTMVTNALHLARRLAGDGRYPSLDD